jgi:hypothetical protein
MSRFEELETSTTTDCGLLKQPYNPKSTRPSGLHSDDAQTKDRNRCCFVFKKRFWLRDCFSLLLGNARLFGPLDFRLSAFNASSQIILLTPTLDTNRKIVLLRGSPRFATD